MITHDFCKQAFIKFWSPYAPQLHPLPPSKLPQYVLCSCCVSCHTKKVTFFCNYKNRIPASISTWSWDSSITHLTIETLNRKPISVACIIKFHCNLMIQILVPKFLSCRGCDWLMGFSLIKLHGKIKVQIFGEHFELVLWGFLMWVWIPIMWMGLGIRVLVL